MSLGHTNSIIHEIQKAESIHLSDDAKSQIERLVMAAIQDENKNLQRDKQYWMNMYLNQIEK